MSFPMFDKLKDAERLQPSIYLKGQRKSPCFPNISPSVYLSSVLMGFKKLYFNNKTIKQTVEPNHWVQGHLPILNFQLTSTIAKK